MSSCWQLRHLRNFLLRYGYELTGKSLRFIPAHDIATGLGPEKYKALSMFHALTGCDTVSAFNGRGKLTTWSVWESFPELTDALS